MHEYIEYRPGILVYVSGKEGLLKKMLTIWVRNSDMTRSVILRREEKDMIMSSNKYERSRWYHQKNMLCGLHNS